MSINKKLFIISLALLALIPVGFVFEAMFRTEWYGSLGIGLVLAGMFNGTAVLIISLGILGCDKPTTKTT